MYAGRRRSIDKLEGTTFLRLPWLMHRVLQIDDVFRNIMIFLLPSPTDKDLPVLRTTLYNIALTCTSFTGPAIDTLWFYMDNLTPLFELLSNFEDSEDGNMVRGNRHSMSCKGPTFFSLELCAEESWKLMSPNSTTTPPAFDVITETGMKTLTSLHISTCCESAAAHVFCRIFCIWKPRSMMLPRSCFSCPLSCTIYL